MTKVTKSIELEASPEKVFAFINDMEKMNAVNKGSSEGEYTSKGPVGVGSTLHFVGKAGGSQSEWDMEITEFEKDRKVAMRTIGASKFRMSAFRTIEPMAKGSKLTIAMDYEVPYSILGKIVDRLRVSKDIEKQSERTLQSIKKALEA